jgi:DNA-directed RNA polymerase specialized sigma subunit
MARKQSNKIKALINFIINLSDREIFILVQKYKHRVSQKDISRMLELSNIRISQIEKEMADKLEDLFLFL